MLKRRTLIAVAPLLAAAPAFAADRPAAHPAPRRVAAPRPPADGSFEAYVAGVKDEAQRRGIAPATLDRAFAGVRMNQKVIDLDRHQPETTFTWEDYRTRIVSQARVARGRQLYAVHRDLLAEVSGRYGVAPAVLMGIWAIESNYGQSTGGFNVIEALTTLAREGRRGAFFRSELMDALRILDHGDISPERMTGSYAGAMGQTQFMPDSFLKYAVDYSGDGRRDIWNDLGDVFGSTANYLSREGWRPGFGWGEEVVLPSSFDPTIAGRENRRPVADWLRMGVHGLNDRLGASADTMAAIVLPGGAAGPGYMAYHPNFQAIRRYNPSDFYCISVGMLGDAITA